MPAVAVWAAAVVAVAFIGVVDYASGAELRVFPLYFVPVSLVAWHRGRAGALILAALSSMSWVVSNALAGLTFSTSGLWVANALVQGVAFATVGLLIASLRAAVVREHGLSRTDPVTLALNSRAFYEEAGRLIALCRRKARPVTLAYIDLDHFKEINDARGHTAGDDLLRGISRLIQASVRPSDVFARLGGDEFVLLLPEADADDARAMLERLRLVIGGSSVSSGPPVTATIGAVTFVTPPETVEEAVRHADSRMYAGKSAGGNRVHLDVIAWPAPPHALGISAARR